MSSNEQIKQYIKECVDEVQDDFNRISEEFKALKDWLQRILDEYNEERSQQQCSFMQTE